MMVLRVHEQEVDCAQKIKSTDCFAQNTIYLIESHLMAGAPHCGLSARETVRSRSMACSFDGMVAHAASKPHAARGSVSCCCCRWPAPPRLIFLERRRAGPGNRAPTFIIKVKLQRRRAALVKRVFIVITQAETAAGAAVIDINLTIPRTESRALADVARDLKHAAAVFTVLRCGGSGGCSRAWDCHRPTVIDWNESESHAASVEVVPAMTRKLLQLIFARDGGGWLLALIRSRRAGSSLVRQAVLWKVLRGATPCRVLLRHASGSWRGRLAWGVGLMSVLP